MFNELRILRQNHSTFLHILRFYVKQHSSQIMNVGSRIKLPWLHLGFPQISQVVLNKCFFFTAAFFPRAFIMYMQISQDPNLRSEAYLLPRVWNKKYSLPNIHALLHLHMYKSNNILCSSLHLLLHHFLPTTSSNSSKATHKNLFLASVYTVPVETVSSSNDWIIGYMNELNLLFLSLAQQSDWSLD